VSTTVDLPDLNVWLALACHRPLNRCCSARSPRLGWCGSCTDAYLAALAIANGWRLVSLDRDFERFEGLERLALRLPRS